MYEISVFVVVERVSITYNQSTREKRVRPRHGDPGRRHDRERATKSQKMRQVLELLSFSFFRVFYLVLRQGFNQGSLIFVNYLFGWCEVLLLLSVIFLDRSSNGVGKGPNIR